MASWCGDMAGRNVENFAAGDVSMILIGRRKLIRYGHMSMELASG